MDPKLFKQHLDQLAEWRYLDADTPVASKRGRRGRPRKTNPDILDLDQHNEPYTDPTPTTEPNPTHSIQVTKMHCCAQICDDCGRDCPEGRHVEQKLYDRDRWPHWRKRCNTCGLTKNPYTGEFDLNSSEVGIVFADWVRGKHYRKIVKNKTKNPIAESIVAIDGHSVAYEDDTSVITFNSDWHKPG